MKKIGFGDRYIKLVIDCITTINYTILINGIRQGDPISPYLFILCAESFSALLKQAEIQGEIKGMVATRGGLRVTHLLFGDNSVLFCRATINEWERIQGLITIYEKALGQDLNMDATIVFFSSNISEKRQ